MTGPKLQVQRCGSDRAASSRSAAPATWAFGIALVVLGCAPGDRTPAEKEGSGHEWQLTYQDSAYRVSLDTSRIRALPEGVYLVWYQTVHSALREHEGAPWNREIIHSFLRCAPVSFKTVHVAIFLNDGPLVAEQGGAPGDVRDEPWTEATAAVDRPALTRACEIILERSPTP